MLSFIAIRDLAARAFADPFALIEQHRIEYGGLRCQTLGMVENCLLLLVAHTFVDEQGIDVIRIISARRADRRERKR